MDSLAERPHEHILLLDTNVDDLRAERECIARQLPRARITPVSSLEQFHKELNSEHFDLIVVDDQLARRNSSELIHELKLRETEPGVLVVSSAADPRLVADLYNSGCHKCLVKEGRWLEELGPSVRHLLRLKRLEEENRKLVARLTEANMLLQEKNRRLDEFSATVAHDIRGPLGGISMKLEYMLEYQDSLDARYRELIANALRSTQRLMGLVQSMYSYAKLGAKAGRMEPIVLGQLVEEVISDMHFNDSVQIKIGLGDLPTVWGSADLLRRLFINLLSNAVKYNDKPEIIINIGVRRIIERSLGKFVEVFVEDNGPGIPAEELSGIFSMFTRGASVRGDQEGAGIGLAVVQRIVELHFGDVTVESEVGKGTRFVVSLPTERLDFVSAR
jgi:signal transduction histidine kinase